MQPPPDLCVYCHKAAGATVVLAEGAPHLRTHRECREKRACGFCGHCGLTQLCSEPACTQVLHTWCFRRHSANIPSVCDLHLFGKKRDRYAGVKPVLARVAANPHLALMLKRLGTAGNSYAAGCCSGHVFWYSICSQYFPALTDLSVLPDFRCAKLASSEAWEVLSAWSPTQPVDTLLEDVVTKLSVNRMSMDSLKRELLHNMKSQPASDPLAVSKQSKDFSAEERFLLCDLKLLQHKPEYEELFQCLEAKQRAEVADARLGGSSLSVHTDVLKREDEFSCNVCSDGDYEDDNLIVICSVPATQTCETSVHAKCYGIATVPSGDWICSMCQAYGPSASKQLRCVFCPLPGGALKETENLNDGSLGFAHYPAFDDSKPRGSGNTEKVWGHVLCAQYVQGVVIGDKDRMERINVAGVGAERVGVKCDICGKAEGVCVQCHHRKCDFSFHPQCGRQLIVAGRKCGVEDGEVFCHKHRPIKLGKVIEERDKKKVEDLLGFARLWEKWESKTPLGAPFRRIRKRSDVDWTFDESEQLEDEIARFLQQLNERQSKPFRVIVSRRSASRGGQVVVSGPETYNIVAPEAILKERIAIASRTPEECYRYYASRLMQRMRFELELCKAQVKIYTPKKPADKHPRQQSPDAPTKRPHKQTVSQLEPKRPQELFCVCRQPYVETQPKNGTPEAEYQALVSRNSMVYCAGCSDWFHYGCIGFMPDGTTENNWLCAQCRGKHMS